VVTEVLAEMNMDYDSENFWYPNFRLNKESLKLQTIETGKIITTSTSLEVKE
jgi:hypothetical protein